MDNKIEQLIDLAVTRAIEKRNPKTNAANTDTIKIVFQLFVVCSIAGAIIIVLGIWGAMDPNTVTKSSLSLIALWVPMAIILGLYYRSGN
jgi:uncharacterized protein (DUF983 family)